jgi:hypothetical protein
MVFVVKEGGGGDWGQVAWRKEGDTTPAASLAPLTNVVWYLGPPDSTSTNIPGTNTPTLSVTSTTTGLTLTYENGELQSADNVEGPYARVTGATSPHPVTFSSATRKFYRVARIE